MSKLRADITYFHHLSISEIILDIDKSFNNQVRNNNLDDLIEEDHEGLIKDNEILTEELDNKTDELNLENEFCEYLQGWADMLEEEYIVNDKFDNEFDKDNIIDDIEHPATDTNAKWKLITLFKNDLKLSF